MNNMKLILKPETKTTQYVIFSLHNNSVPSPIEGLKILFNYSTLEVALIYKEEEIKRFSFTPDEREVYIGQGYFFLQRYQEFRGPNRVMELVKQTLLTENLV